MIYNRLMYSAFMMATTTDKYFNKGVKAPYAPHIGHIIRGTPDKIIVFGRGGNERYMIYIYFNKLVEVFPLRMYGIINKYKVSRRISLSTSHKDP
jgi:hypothetical protein